MLSREFVSLLTSLVKKQRPLTYRKQAKPYIKTMASNPKF